MSSHPLPGGFTLLLIVTLTNQHFVHMWWEIQHLPPPYTSGESLEPSRMGFQDERSGIWLPLQHVNFTLVSLHPVLTQTWCSHPCLDSPRQAQAQGYSRVLLKDLLIMKEHYIIMQLLGNTTNGKWPKLEYIIKAHCTLHPKELLAG